MSVTIHSNWDGLYIGGTKYTAGTQTISLTGKTSLEIKEQIYGGNNATNNSFTINSIT